MASQSHREAERQFSAFARPRGDRALGVSAPLVEIHERLKGGGKGHRKLQAVRMLSHAEAAQLHYELGEALRSLELAKELANSLATRPRAYTGPYPIRGKTLADVGFEGEPAHCEGEI